MHISRAIFGLVFANLVVAVIIIGITLTASYSTQKQLVANQRAGCLAGSHDRANYVNNFRIIADADKNAGKLSAKPTAATKLRANEALALNADILPIDGHIDYHDANLLTNKVDRQTVEKDHFDCIVQYPNPSFGF